MMTLYGGTYRSVYVSAFTQALAEIKKRITPTKRKWTETQIEEARTFVASHLIPVTRSAILFTGEGSIVRAERVHRNYKGELEMVCSATAKCSDNDEFNLSVGKMVALSHLLGFPLPKWIKE
jgi:hypothetical protein